jgi:uncharacterized SAM-binding protein YcdF (DUF218 family)
MTYTQPLLLIVLTVCCVGLLRLRSGKGKWLLAAGVLGLFLVSWPPVDWLLSRPLEARYPVRPFRPGPEVQAIVVFSAGISRATYERPYMLPEQDTYKRCEYGAWIHKQIPTAPVLACGGVGPEGGKPFSLAMRDVFQKAGVPEGLIWTEERSRSTHENAVYGADILRQHGIRDVVLVVDARSMPRAEACLRKQGIHVVPAPCDFREWGPLKDELLPNWSAVRNNENTLHEVLGLGWYWLRGWI